MYAEILQIKYTYMKTQIKKGRCIHKHICYVCQTLFKVIFFRHTVALKVYECKETSKGAIVTGGQICFMTHIYMTQLLLLGKVEYGGGPIFKVVLEC